MTNLAEAQKGISSVILKNGTVLKGIIKTIDPTDAVTIEISGVETKIKMDNIALIEAADQKEHDPHSQEVKTERVVVMPEDPLVGFKGFLLEKGNNVYVYGDDNDYEKMGAEEIKKLLILDGFWNVVDKISDAHFTINYLIESPNSQTVKGWNTSNFHQSKIKRDPESVFLTISSWRSDAAHPLKYDKIENIFSPRHNIQMAKKLYNKAIVPLQEDIEKGKLSSRIKKKFTIK